MTSDPIILPLVTAVYQREPTVVAEHRTSF